MPWYHAGIRPGVFDGIGIIVNGADDMDSRLMKAWYIRGVRY